MNRTIVPIVIFIILLSHHEPGGANDGSRLALIESLLSRGVSWTEDSPYFNTVDMVYFNGHFYSDKPPLLPLYSAFMIFPVHLWIKFDTAIARSILYYLVVLTSSGFSLVLLCTLFKKVHAMFAIPSVQAKWSLYGLLLGTCLLPYAGTYNTPIVEATLIFAVFVSLLAYNRTRRSRYSVFSGLLLGLGWLVHPFSGTVFAISTGLYFLRSRISDFFRYMACVVFLTIGMTVILHQGLYSTYKPFYFTPESYLYKGSLWLKHPVIPGLTRDKIVHRFHDLNLPDHKLKQTLTAFEDYKKSVGNPLSFMYHKLIGYDYLVLNPLVIFSLFLMCRGMFRKDFRLRWEFLWLFVGLAGLYSGLTIFRIEPGNCFGNIYLVLILPLVIFGASLVSDGMEHLPLFKLLFWVSFAMVLPGTLQPWQVPPAVFIKTNFLLSTGLVLGMCVYFLSARVRKGIPRWASFLSRWRSLALVLLFLWFGGEMLLYSSGSFAILFPRGLIYLCAFVLYYFAERKLDRST